MSSRKQFLQSMGMVIAGTTILPAFASPSRNFDQNPQLDPEMVQEFVSVSHGKFDRVKALCDKQPLLIYSSHDWGNGDFENGIEAAGHVGNKEIANYLLERGARINFFTLCMLGKFEIVSALLKEFPQMVNAAGPHGFTPLHHAIQGGDDAKKVKKLLESMGATETNNGL